MTRYSDATVAWAEQWGECWRCRRRGLWKNGLEMHHMVRGANRKADDLATTIMLCGTCHDELHRGVSGFGLIECLALKMLLDPSHYDRAKVNALRHRAPDSISETDVALKVSELFERARR